MQWKHHIVATPIILSPPLFLTSVLKSKMDSLPDYASSPNVSEVPLGCKRSDNNRGRRSSHPHHASLPSASLVRLGGGRSHCSRDRHAEVGQSPAYWNVFGLLEILRCVVLRSSFDLLLLWNVVLGLCGFDILAKIPFWRRMWRKYVGYVKFMLNIQKDWNLKMTFRSILGSGKGPAKSLIHNAREDYILVASQISKVSLEHKWVLIGSLDNCGEQFSHITLLISISAYLALPLSLARLLVSALCVRYCRYRIWCESSLQSSAYDQTLFCARRNFLWFIPRPILHDAE